MNPKIGITDTNLKNVTQILNALLSDEYTLFTKTLNYHWNVQTLHFHDLHKFFDEQHEQLTVITDDVAERIRALGNATPATLVEFQKLTRLKEEQAIYPNDKKMIENQKSNPGVSEDDVKAAGESLQKSTDEYATKLEQLSKGKEVELMQV